MTAPNRQFKQSLATRLDNIDVLSETYRAAPLQCVQTTRGPLGAELHGVSTLRVEVRDAAFDAGVTLTAADPFPRFGLGIGLAGDVQLPWTSLTSSNVGYITGSDGMIVRLQPGARWCNISLDWDLFIGAAETHGYSLPSGDRSVGVPSSLHRDFAALLSRVARGEQYFELADAELEDELALAVLRILQARQPAGRDMRSGHQRIVHRVVELIEAEYSGTVTVTGLCKQFGVSERTLQYRFKDATGLSVQQYLLIYRLQRARAMLLRGEYQQVGEVAGACGIHHAGRFAQYYRRLFRQSPRETQRDARSVR
ncbi:MAG: helix-turn-helix domain-containing protein [Pseudomonadales bacterium]|nr:helix-turn-helix domain-containing protein [Pseudomonadales bacterium]MCP5190803.1 helix-turn-helix domain-containing protein [Pseudomonadales bacterium]